MIIKDTKDAAALFGARFFEGSTGTTIAIAYLDKDLTLFEITIIPVDADEQPTFPLRSIVSDALRLQAVALIVALRRSGNDPTPTHHDRKEVSRLLRACDTINVRVIDCLILAAEGMTNFRAHGWL